MTESATSNSPQTVGKDIQTMDESRATAEQPISQPDTDSPESQPSVLTHSLRRLRAEAEIVAISRALEQTGWNRKRAAQLLNISYRGLLYKIRQHNITCTAELQLSSFARR
jgi:DNA-binding NtrC family response regulator